MQNHTPFHIQVLRDELRKRQDKNSNYSLRGFAKFLRISPAWLSSVLAGDRAVTAKMAEKIFPKLCTDMTDLQKVIRSVAVAQVKRKTKKPEKKAKLIVSNSTEYLSNEFYRRLDSWYHSAILELISVQDFSPSAEWISKQLGISKLQAEEGILDLVEANLLRSHHGHLIRIENHISTKNKKQTDAALKKIQKEFREKSIVALETQPLGERSHTHITMAIDPKLIPEAKIKIQKFQRELCEFLESKEKKQVYVMEIGLFNLHINKGEQK